MSRLLLVIIRCYQRFLSPLKPPTCRFIPTCSAYAAEAVQQHGAWRGSTLAIMRVCRCHPWGGHGHDPVPNADPITSPEAHH